MKHRISVADQTFKQQVEFCAFPVADFDHRAHIRLAYIYLVEYNTVAALNRVRRTLKALLKHAGIDPVQKYHETLTKAWILAVRHFMENTADAQSAEDFIAKNPVVLDSKIMMRHYSAKVLFSDLARQSFVQPDLEPIPVHDA